MVKKTKNISKFIDEEGQKAVKAAVAEAEKDTSGEIVIVVAKDSGRYDRAEDIFGLLLIVVFFVIGWKFTPFFTESSPAYGLLASIAIVIAGFEIGSAMATYIPVLKLPFLGKKEIFEEVNHRASECFYEYAIGNTKGATGVLIYISLFEHAVVVRPDRSINISRKKWDDICASIVNGLKNKDAARGLVEGINKCGELLKEHCPLQGDNPNELSDKIHFKY
ncbi:MAG: hypothetical protein PQ612_09105 [Rickettsiales bacterium]|nr:hypothetical protein [Pseudomonadota bacterium]MDA0967208.1 hypothetical protein [Pseudomonadota bacterium]MDG4544131.1 hypothetical protein [Rickettsiales bacterium]MDG4546312.1 hypothetical protein [Rickettsiales bacterium]MDG4548455.1 hypothetical protein [Rickettsiales bacterium]